VAADHRQGHNPMMRWPWTEGKTMENKSIGKEEKKKRIEQISFVKSSTSTSDFVAVFVLEMSTFCQVST
jgi:hypothetical protein